MAKKEPTPLNTIFVGMGIGLGIFFYLNNTAATESVAARIGTSVLAAVVTVAVSVGIFTLIRKARKKK